MRDCQKCTHRECKAAGVARSVKVCFNYTTKTVLVRHIAKGEQRRREYDWTEIEDRLKLKLDTLKDRLQHLIGDELEELEWDLDACLRVAKLFTGRKQPPEPPRMDEIEKSAELGPCTTWTPDTPPAGFDGTQKNPIPIRRET